MNRSCKQLKLLFAVCCVFGILLVVYLDVKMESNATEDDKLRAKVSSPVTAAVTVEELSEEITVVTAFFNIGRFQKGESRTFFSPDTYKRWSFKFSKLLNPIVVYTDSKDFHELFMKIREQHLDKTKILLISRNSSWAFQKEKNISDIFSQPNYPQHHPNTVVPLYGCAQHAKYDVINRAASSNYFNTKYFAWIDIGYFRNKQPRKNFRLVKPRDFDETRIAFNLVNNVSMAMKPQTIFRQNIVYVGGGMFYGEKNVVIQFALQYRRALDFFLSKDLSNTDQQVIFALYSVEGRATLNPGVDIQLYWSNPPGDWFYLGTSMIREDD